MSILDWVPTAGVAVLFLIGLFAYFRDRKQAKDAQEWPTAQATVLDGSVRLRAGVQGNASIWFVQLRFSFQAEGSYYGNIVEIKVDGEEAGLEYIRAHQGKALTVRYKPKNPDEVRVYPSDAESTSGSL